MILNANEGIDGYLSGENEGDVLRHMNYDMYMLLNGKPDICLLYTSDAADD